MKTIASVSLLLGVALSAACVDRQTVLADAPERPNIVLLLADDLGYGELGCYGGLDIPTPHIDSIAQHGVRFTDGYVTASYCAASRAGMLTGRYQTRFGFEFNPIGARNEDPNIGLPVGQRTIADYLHDAGYATGLFGKWHLGGTARFHPQRRGFDEFFGFMHEGHYFVPPPWTSVTTWLRRRTLPDGTQGRWSRSDGRLIWSTHMRNDEPDYDANNPILRNSQPVNEREHLTDALSREAESFIQRHREQPFFLFLSYNAVHSPMQGAESYMSRFGHIKDVHRRIFAAMLSHLDDSVGRVLDKLRQSDMDRRTLVVFLSDNGGPTRELTSSNRPLRGEKGQLYEGGIRVPMIVQWVGRIPAGRIETGRVETGRVETGPVSSMDLLPTILAAAGISAPDHMKLDNVKRDRAKLDGINLLPLLSGSKRPPDRDTLYWRLGGRNALRYRDWKIVRHGRAGRKPGNWELYNLAEDVGESRNLAAEQPDRLRDLTRRWERIDAEMVEPLW